ncbi:zinc finger protein 28 [Trichonephila clavipes]|nr:zinc finger protein 28 [Trichonephila clavipes]
MEDKIFLNEYGRGTEDDLERTFVTLEPISTRRGNAFQSARNEFQPKTFEEILNYSSQSASNNCSLIIQDNWIEPEVSNANRPFTEAFLKWQNNFQEIQPNSGFQCNEFSRVNMEVQGREQVDSIDISTVGHCIRTACDCLLGINSQHNDPYSKIFASESEGSILSEFNSFDPKGEPSVIQNEKLGVIVGRNSERKSETIELKEGVFKFDSINSGLDFSQSSIYADPLTENNNFLLSTEKLSLEKIYCEKCFKTFKRKCAFLKHKCVKIGDKDFQNGNSRQNIYQEEPHSEHVGRNTEEKSFQCGVCEKKLSRKQTLANHMRMHTGTRPYRCNMCEKSFSLPSNLTVHMRKHTREKPFQCNVCKKCFIQSSHINRHMKTHTGEKPFQCPSCKRKFSESNHLKKHMLTHKRQNTF